MDIFIDDKTGSGILAGFADAIGAKLEGRYVFIPESKGGGYLTGFSWGDELRMMIRNYHLNEGVSVEWMNNSIASGREPIVFQLSGIFPSAANKEGQLIPERPNVLICRQMVTSVITMPSNTMFGSVTIAVFRPYLQQLFGHLDHPVVRSILDDKESSFAYEIGLSPEMFRVGTEMRQKKVPASLESQFFRLKSEELLCYIFSILTERAPVVTSRIHIDDIKAVYAIRNELRSNLDTAPDIAKLASYAGMSERKLRRLFNQIFGMPVFEYYQAMRMEEAGRLLKMGLHTVSEVGYKLGFTNLGHFSRIFEQHHGLKPKKYSVSV